MSDKERRAADELHGDEAPPSAAEQQQAAALAAVLDGTAAAPDEELGELQAAAEMIRASLRPAELTPARRDELVAAALAAAPAAAAAPAGARSPSRWRRAAPLLALAASLLAIVGAVLGGLPLVDRHGRLTPAQPPAYSARALSRPSDALLGRPIADRAGAARRLDQVLADRLAGYRELRLARR